jgi:hypothetical protein
VAESIDNRNLMSAPLAAFADDLCRARRTVTIALRHQGIDWAIMEERLRNQTRRGGKED